MTLHEFLTSLARDGVARVTPGEAELPDGDGLARTLAELHQRAALELAVEAPALDGAAARGGAQLLHRLAAGVLAGRAPEGAVVWEPLAPPPPATPAAAFSADLALRWLADLERLALGLPEDDPRRASLRAVAHAHPLSSIGVRGLAEVEPGVVLEHRGLAQLYVDRALARGALERLAHPRLAALAREAEPFVDTAPSASAGPSRPRSS